jgi:mono/diheme cytochrome c family protein
MYPHHPYTFRAAAFAAGALLLNLASPASAVQPDARIDTGRHLVEDIGLCADCHSPRQADGSFDRSRWLQGAPLGFAPTAPMPWAPAAPGIAGLPTLTDAQVIHLLTTGERPDGTRPLPPMPAYRLSPAEAEAVVAYLRSLSPAP